MPIPVYASVQPLSPGARVALIAPAGPLRGSNELEHAIGNVLMFGWEPVVGAHVLACTDYLAGTDAQRLDDLNRAVRDDSIDAIWCVRGGYGVMRILDGIDYEALRRRAKAIIGYSDITALHAAVGRECGHRTYHGPTARETITPFSRNSLERAVRLHADPCGVAHGARTLRGGIAQGRLMGGNLALVSALVGTRYCPDLRGAILVLEDVNEPVYRIDRMLRQLLMSGALTEVAAIAFGQSTAQSTVQSTAAIGEVTGAVTSDAVTNMLDRVLRELADTLNVPSVAGLPIGHIDEQWTLPLGAAARLDADALTLTVDAL